MQEVTRGRGRPRPAETIARDISIENLLWRDRSLADIAELEKLTHSQTYHALRRLQLAGRICVVRDGRQHLWGRTQTPHA